MAILIDSNGKILVNSNGKILTNNNSNSEPVNLTRKIPVPNLVGASEIYFDTSKSIEEVIDILKNITYAVGNYIPNYIICTHSVGGWYQLVIYNYDENDFSIYFETDDYEYTLFDVVNGWNTEIIIDGKFEPTNFKGGRYSPSYGKQNDILFGIIWAEEPIYIPTREKVALDDLDYTYEYVEADSNTSRSAHTFHFWNATLNNKQLDLNLSSLVTENDSLHEFSLNLNGARNCKIFLNFQEKQHIISVITILDLFNYVVIFDYESQKTYEAGFGVYLEGWNYPADGGGDFLIGFDEDQYAVSYIIIDIDNEGLAKIYLQKAYEY